MKYAIALALTFAAMSCESAIVGAKCQAGFTRCGDECVNLQRDFRNCGRCENLCNDFICLKGKCESRGPLDAAAEEGPEAGLADAAIRE
jgi:Stigma-specific protein, Stig1